MILTVTAESTAAPTLRQVPPWAAASATGFSAAKFISARPTETPIERLGVASILGEQFSLEREDGCYFLVHPVWSLVASSVDITGLSEDLRSEAEDMLEIFSEDPPQDLSDESKAMLRFAAELVALAA